MILYISIIAVIFIVELLLKNYVEKNRELHEKIPVAKGLIILRKYHNEGAFLDLGAKRKQIVAVVSVVLSLVVTGIFIMSLSMKGSTLLKTGLSILLGGAFSNTYDRLKRKYVVDYFSFGIGTSKIKKVVYNISDFCILIGALCIVIAGYK